MMRKNVVSLLLVVVMLTSFAGLANANLLTNPGFETAGVDSQDPAGWGRSSTGAVIRHGEAGQPGHGDWQLLLMDLDANAWHWAFQRVDVTAGVEYTASAEFKASMQSATDEKIFIYLEWLDAGGGMISNALSAYKPTDPDYVPWAWVSREVTSVAPTGAVQVEVRTLVFTDGNGDSGWCADNVVLVPEPATLCLLGAGLLMLRKRKNG